MAGVNVFAAAADGRRWQDHRIPGGLGFSVNSVGHLVKSKIMQTALRDFRQIIGETSAPFPTTPVGSLPSALEFAMRTIHGAVPVMQWDGSLRHAPVAPPSLKGSNAIGTLPIPG